MKRMKTFEDFVIEARSLAAEAQNPEDTHDEPTQDAPDYYDRLRDSQVEAMRLKR